MPKEPCWNCHGQGKLKKRVNEESGLTRYSWLKFKCGLCKGKGYVEVGEPTKARKPSRKLKTQFNYPLAVTGSAAAFAVMWHQAEPRSDLSVPLLAGVIAFMVMGRFYKAIFVVAVLLFVSIMFFS